MHIYNKIPHVLLLTFCYMCRCLQRHLQEGIYVILRTIVNLFGYGSEVVLYMVLQ